MKRDYKKLLLDSLKMFPCVIITGVRQCGKTTLLHELPEKWKIFDLEKSSDYEVVSRDPELFLRLNSSFTAIDEGQILPSLFPALRVAIDADREKCGRFVITGSSSPALLKSVSESLAGRVAVLELAPFSANEAYGTGLSKFFELILSGAGIEDLRKKLVPLLSIGDIHQYWLKGGYPEPVLKSRGNKRFFNLWMQNYFQSYLNLDVMRLFPGLNAQKYRLFLQMLANLSGSIINYSEVARAVGVSQPTIRDYFNIADGTFIWRHISPYEKDACKRIVKHPKGFLRDSGLLHFMLHINSVNDLAAHPSMGRSWESMVTENIIRGFNAIGASFEYYYYRTGAGAEIDLLLDGEFGLLPVEIKYSQSVSARDLRALKDFVRERKCRLGIVINNDENIKLYDKNLIGIPFSFIA